jgi:ribonuclease T1
VQRAILVAAILVLAWLFAQEGLRSGDDTSTVRPAPAATSLASSSASGSATTTPLPSTDPVSGLPWVDVAVLPPEAGETLELIRAGGPFPYPRNDNQVFLNREGLLPRQSRGYYREFTVETPGSDDRGARRIVTGAQGERYWTDDHYGSFARIREAT